MFLSVFSQLRVPVWGPTSFPNSRKIQIHKDWKPT